MLAKTVLACSLTLALLAPSVAAAELRVAAASSAQEALQDISRRFERETGHHVSLVFGASGKFAAQLAQGAPFDVFFSADNEYPYKLYQQGLTEAPRRYARGRLVLWVPEGSSLSLSTGMAALGDPRVHTIAIANPKVAPYGRAAIEALRHRKLYETLSAKLVLGENVSQAAQFVQAGGADLGMVPLSLALSKLKGHGQYWLVPAAWHAPIDSEAAVVKASPERAVARQFLAFCTSAPLAGVWRHYGLASE